MSNIWPNNIWHKSIVGRRRTEVWRGNPGYFSVNCRFSTSTQDQFAIKDLGVACAQKNRILFVYVLVHCTSLLLSQQQFPIEWSWRFTWRRNPHLDPITKTCANAGSAISILHKGHKLLNVVTQELETSFSSFPTILVCVIHHFILLRLQKEFDYNSPKPRPCAFESDHFPAKISQIMQRPCESMEFKLRKKQTSERWLSLTTMTTTTMEQCQIANTTVP